MPAGLVLSPAGTKPAIGIDRTTVLVFVSMMFNVPAFSAFTNTRPPRGSAKINRGRPAMGILVTRAPVLALSTTTVLPVSVVTYTVVPSGVTTTPSGSPPTTVDQRI